MDSIHLVVEGAPRTKKNSPRILRNRSTGRPFVAPSATYKTWEQKALWQLRALWRGRPAISEPVNMAAVVYRDRATGDLLNYLAAISDALERAGIVVNDRLIVSTDGSRMDKDSRRPRVELVLSSAAKSGGECTECGLDGATVKRTDAGGTEHWFHPECWASFCAWLTELPRGRR